MSGMTSDQLHRSTLRIYSSLMDEFNPSLQELVSLGHSYVHAFQTLAVTSEAYFSALSKIGENTFHTKSSRSMGDVLIQISESQRRLMVELDGAVRSFRTDVLQEMDSNIRLDKGYISGSRTQYETEVHQQAAALERQRRRGHNQDCSEHMQFLRESHGKALKEEERRYRFLSEKHCGLMRSIGRIMNKTGGSLQQTAEAWSRDVDATREPEARRPADVINSMGMREVEVTRSREEQPLGDVPSRAPSPQGSLSRPPAGRTTRARVAHQPGGSKPTMLPFNRGEIITVLVQQPRNGWLYGRADSSSREGWFPVSYVEGLDDPPKTTSSGSSLRSSSSMSDLLSQPESSSHSVAPPPAPPLSSYQQYEMSSITTPEKRTKSKSELKSSKPHASQPELFPRGTNPFATVKLRPTSTDDRSTPRVCRR